MDGKIAIPGEVHLAFVGGRQCGKTVLVQHLAKRQHEIPESKTFTETGVVCYALGEGIYLWDIPGWGVTSDGYWEQYNLQTFDELYLVYNRHKITHPSAEVYFFKQSMSERSHRIGRLSRKPSER
eukprot:763100-Hanusia_phi.AAC.19